jgi:hypothetical protein
MDKKEAARKNLVQAVITAVVTFVLVLIRTADVSTSLIIAVAIFLSYMMWVIIYYRNPDR